MYHKNELKNTLAAFKKLKLYKINELNKLFNILNKHELSKFSKNTQEYIQIIKT